MQGRFTRWILNACLTTVLLLGNVNAYTQDKSGLRISLLTCSPGEDLYALFGHTAIRVTDSVSLTDIVYNYGTFNFSDPNFYIKFARGKLLYYLSTEHFNDFAAGYYYEGRNIREQVIDATESEKLEIYQALRDNLLEENRYYHYDFFLDNCTTRPRDLLLKHLHPAPVLPAVMDTLTTFREAIHLYLNRGKQYWSKLGIDILLGARTDAVMQPMQQLFLPDNLMTAMDKSTANNRVLLTSSPYVLQEKKNRAPMISPLVAIGFVSLLFAFITSRKIKGLASWTDRLIFFITGLLGVILVLMWVATDHTMTKNNYNLVWALPTHLFISLWVNSDARWVRRYFLITAIVTGLLALVWFILPQQMNPALLPWVLLLVYRSSAKSISHAG
ncbi:MAG TPA: DUF4105 domain-containing protein [Ferruginibacter sp.]|nr:DUF4105 domain-containing protein [Ferruginibacter sp.]